ncbi:hypothetical protein Q3O60_04795 [Alkalimonas collagenimarina]|uniref:Uncharacterized protein n=1 Tax=Alkalimonas collagenimarina TaxID=400390 RepID=A0ABT9GX16_9GAMM|nr:hypothetical protein [Alkalimonas collagenimarina]MDP4535508.1 hypothetical protein [Alkalimonas collagenimarina]
MENQLLKLHNSPVITGEALRCSLGYRSVEAFRQALSRNTVPVRIFTIENRRGKFALVRDIAIWLANETLKSIKD